MFKTLSLATLLVLGATTAHAACYQNSDARCITTTATALKSAVVIQIMAAPGQECKSAGFQDLFTKRADGRLANTDDSILSIQDSSISIQVDGAQPEVLNEMSCPQ